MLDCKIKKFEDQTVFSTRVYKLNEDDQVPDEIELSISMNFIQNSAESDIDNISIRSQIDHQIQNQGTKESSGFLWKFFEYKILFMKLLKKMNEFL